MLITNEGWGRGSRAFSILQCICLSILNHQNMPMLYQVSAFRVQSKYIQNNLSRTRHTAFKNIVLALQVASVFRTNYLHLQSSCHGASWEDGGSTWKHQDLPHRLCQRPSKQGGVQISLCWRSVYMNYLYLHIFHIGSYLWQPRGCNIGGGGGGRGYALRPLMGNLCTPVSQCIKGSFSLGSSSVSSKSNLSA